MSAVLSISGVIPIMVRSSFDLLPEVASVAPSLCLVVRVFGLGVPRALGEKFLTLMPMNF